MTKQCGDDVPVIGSGLMLARPFKQSGARYGVPLSEVRRFGRCSRYGDHRSWNIGELTSGEIVHFMHKDQSPDMLKVLRKRLKDVHFETYCNRDRPEIFAWEKMHDCQHGIGEVVRAPAHRPNSKEDIAQSMTLLREIHLESQPVEPT
jgi:predicted Fe-S protein YdhL (DUF1289 family)